MKKTKLQNAPLPKKGWEPLLTKDGSLIDFSDKKC